MEASETPQATVARPQAPPVGELDRICGPYHHVGYGAPAIHQHPHLSADLATDPRQLSRELVGDESVGW